MPNIARLSQDIHIEPLEKTETSARSASYRDVFTLTIKNTQYAISSNQGIWLIFLINPNV